MLTVEEILSDVVASPGFRNMKAVNVNSRGENGQTPLHWMAILGDAVGIRLLVGAGASVNAVDDSGNAPLHEAVTWRQSSAASALMELGAETRLKNARGQSPKDLAESSGYGPVLVLFQ